MQLHWAIVGNSVWSLARGIELSGASASSGIKPTDSNRDAAIALARWRTAAGIQDTREWMLPWASLLSVVVRNCSFFQKVQWSRYATQRCCIPGFASLWLCSYLQLCTEIRTSNSAYRCSLKLNLAELAEMNGRDYPHPLCFLCFWASDGFPRMWWCFFSQ